MAFQFSSLSSKGRCEGLGIGTLLMSIAKEICAACSGTSSMYIMAVSVTLGFWKKMAFKESIYNNWPSSVKLMASITKEDSVAIEDNDISTPMSFIELPSVHASDRCLHYTKCWEMPWTIG